MLQRSLLDAVRLNRPDTMARRDPFPFLVAHHQLPEESRDDLARDFPKHTSAGFFPYDPRECGPTIHALVDAVTGPDFADAIGARLGIDRLSQFPVLVSFCTEVNKRHGTIHTDSKCTVATALMYFNAGWQGTSDGCLRFLAKIDDIDAMLAPEVKPVYGEFVVFRRADNSFHGYLPYGGPRCVMKVAWLTSEEERQRKLRRGGAARVLKKLAGSLDRRLGAGRSRNASHRG